MRASLIFSWNALLVFLIVLPNMGLCQPGLALRCKSCVNNPTRVIHSGNQDGLSLNCGVSTHRNSQQNSGCTGSPFLRKKILEHHNNAELDDQHFPNNYLVSRSMPEYPLPSVFGKMYLRPLKGRTGDDSDSKESGEIRTLKWDIVVPPKPIGEEFIPFLGPRIWTNAPNYFEHARSNLDILSKMPDSENDEENAETEETEGNIRDPNPGYLYFARPTWCVQNPNHS